MGSDIDQLGQGCEEAAVQKLHGVFTVTHDMDVAERFYAAAQGLPQRLRDGARWCQFRLGTVNVARGAPGEAIPGAIRSITVSESRDLDSAGFRVAQAGGAVPSRRDMGSHGTGLTRADPDHNLFQLYARSTAA